MNTKPENSEVGAKVAEGEDATNGAELETAEGGDQGGESKSIPTSYKLYNP